jgi:hypothetical protein
MAIMLAHGFKIATIARLVRNRLASVTLESVRAGDKRCSK